MALGPSKGVLFGLLKDWGRSGVKILRTIGGKVRQYQLEEVTSWCMEGRFAELRGEQMLEEAKRRTERAVRESREGEVSIIGKITQGERESRDEAEMIKVTNPSSAERMYEILKDPASMVIEDEAEGGILESVWMEHVQNEVDKQLVESIRLSILGGENEESVILSVSMPRSTKEKDAARKVWEQKMERDRKKREQSLTEEDLSMLSSSEDEEEEEEILRRKGKAVGKRIGNARTGVPIEGDTQTVIPAVPEVGNSTMSGAEIAEEDIMFGLDDTDSVIGEKPTQGIGESRWAHETKDEEEAQGAMEEDEEDEKGSQDGTKQRWARDEIKLEDLVLEIAIMGSKLEELDEVPRKKRDAQWRGRRNDIRLILLSAGDIVERGCFNDSDRYEVKGGWKAFRTEYLEKGDKLSIGALDEALRYYQ